MIGVKASIKSQLLHFVIAHQTVGKLVQRKTYFDG